MVGTQRSSAKTRRERFDEKWVADDAGCHVWTANTRDGYGRFWDGERNVDAHRWLFLTEHGWLPPEVCHACDKPACVREQCLFPGTKSDNMRDMMAKGRGRNQFGAR